MTLILATVALFGATIFPQGLAAAAPGPVGPTQGPVAADDVATTAEDTPIDIDVLANDSDMDGANLRVTLLSVPEFGTAMANPNGTVRYLPNPDDNGRDSFAYTIDDGAGGIDTGTVSVTVTPVDDRPIAIDDGLVTTLDTPSTIAVLANDVDADDDPLILLLATAPANGSATVEADGSITYFPDPGYAGSDGFDYWISEGAGDIEIGHVSVKVTLVNHPPLGVLDDLAMAEDTTGSLDPTANDTDEEGGNLVVAEVTQAAHGSVALHADGTVGYTPEPNYNGPDLFQYMVVDGAGAFTWGQVSVSVGSVNDAPVGADDFATTPRDTSINIVVAANDTDADSPELRAVSIGQPGLGSAVVEVDGAVTYTPPANYVGIDSFSYVVSDGRGGFDTARVFITVTATAARPRAPGPRG
jgi:hypothetical protein